jgi:Protein of unknown function (DUF2889)
VRKKNSMENFNRDINYSISIGEDGGIVLTGKMKDRFHDIEIEVGVDADSLKVINNRVQFRKSPSPCCDRAEKQLQKLNGVVIGRGLTRQITLATGGTEGCSNLRTLLTGLLPLALNVKAAAGFEEDEAMLEAIRQKLTGSCVGYPVEEA